jgi:hypothetical protein
LVCDFFALSDVSGEKIAQHLCEGRNFAIDMKGHSFDISKTSPNQPANGPASEDASQSDYDA